MDIPYLRNEFLKNKEFLKSLYLNNPRRNYNNLQRCTENEVNILIKILHLISNGNISLKKENFAVLKKSKRLNVIKNNFESKVDFLNCLKLPLQEKINLVKKLSALYNALLFTMFNVI